MTPSTPTPRYPEYPFASHWHEVPSRDGAGAPLRMHYVDEGARDAPPVLMVHGNPSWSFYYRRLVTALSPRYRCVAPDHIGMGLSDKPGDERYEHTLRRRVEDLESLLDHLGIQANLTLVVHDWGGMIGMAVAARKPERIARLVVLNTGAFHLPPGKKMPWELTLARSPLGALAVRGFNAFCKGAVAKCVVRKPMPPEVAAAYLAPYDSWAHRLAVHRFVQDIPLRPGDQAYDLVSQTQAALPMFADRPMFLGWGLRDFVFDHHFLAEWRRRFPQARCLTLEDAGHYILEDAPETMIPAIQEFLG